MCLVKDLVKCLSVDKLLRYFFFKQVCLGDYIVCNVLYGFLFLGECVKKLKVFFFKLGVCFIVFCGFFQL